MDLTAALLQSASFLGIAIAIVRPRLRPALAVMLLAVALFCVLAGALAPAERELVCRHTFVAYEGTELEPSPVHFKTDTVRASGWLWPLPFLAFSLLWAGILGLRTRAAVNPFALPLALAWTATACWLGMQKLAAPAAVVQPFGIDRFLWPAGLCLTLLLARAGGRFLPLLLALSLGVVAARLPAALFSKYASDHRLGTSLDVSSIVDIVNPMTHYQFDPRLEPGSAVQQFWLIWAEHVLFYPAFHLLSFAGIAIGAFMLQKHARMPPE